MSPCIKVRLLGTAGSIHECSKQTTFKLALPTSAIEAVNSGVTDSSNDLVLVYMTQTLFGTAISKDIYSGDVP